ncbi:hypothetical protein TM7_0060 [candidate division TM7 genomosp. GTL1]|nr:hypothetical protein TM7_0060 [candidate division TM7 genomosp. GTL1]
MKTAFFRILIPSIRPLTINKKLCPSFQGRGASGEKRTRRKDLIKLSSGDRILPHHGFEIIGVYFNFLSAWVMKGYLPVKLLIAPFVAAAIVGNFMAESGVNPKALNSIGAWGIAQWLGGRKAGLFKWADATKYDSIPDPRRDLLVQLDWAWYELSHSEKKALTDLTKHTDPKEIRAAAKEFEGNFERSGGALLEKRADFAEQILKKYGNVAAAVGEASGDFGCAVAGEIGGCDAIDAPNRLVQVACAEWQKKIVEDVSMNCDSKKRINAYNVVAGFGNSCGPKQPYCAMFMMYVHKTAGYPLAGTNALAISWRDAYRAKGAWIDRRNGAKPPTPGGAVVYTSGNSYHVGMVVKVNTGARTMDTIEANTSTDGDPLNRDRRDGVHMHKNTPYYSTGRIIGWSDPQKVFKDLK